MFDDVKEKAASELAGAINIRSLVPAIMFWVGGLLAWATHVGPARVLAIVADLDTARTGTLVVASVGAAIVLVCSAGLMGLLRYPLLRLVEGYWPFPFSWLRHRRVARLNARLERQAEDLAMLEVDFRAGILSGPRLARYSSLSSAHSRLPVDPGLRMPTAVGNAIRAAEEHPFQHYGLDAVTIWPRLWLVLPEQTRHEIGLARSRLDSRAEIVGWGALFTIFGVWAWWAIPAGLAVAAIGYAGAVQEARTYADMLRSCFDLHRFDLYRALSWPLPATQEEEWEAGERLTSHLMRNGSRPAFDHSDSVVNRVEGS